MSIMLLNVRILVTNSSKALVFVVKIFLALENIEHRHVEAPHFQINPTALSFHSQSSFKFSSYGIRKLEVTRSVS